jgi:acetyl esterase
MDPTLNRLIKKAYLNGFGDIHLFSAEKMRTYLTHPRIKVTQASYQDFKTADSTALRCYTPIHCQSSELLPAVIYISATAFIIDRLDASNDYCSLLANTLGMRVINIAHRLAPEHKFPRFLNDCIDSIKWIAAHADSLNINQNKISIWGESSGASIAATCTHVLRDEGSNILSHQTLFYPMVDLVTPHPSKDQYAYGYMLDKTFIQWLDKRGFHPEQDRACPLASPLLSPNFHNLPPATIITAEYDPLRDEGRAYVEKLKLANVKVIHKEYTDMIHGFMRFYPKIASSRLALQFAGSELISSIC